MQYTRITLGLMIKTFNHIIVRWKAVGEKILHDIIVSNPMIYVQRCIALIIINLDYLQVPSSQRTNGWSWGQEMKSGFQESHDVTKLIVAKNVCGLYLSMFRLAWFEALRFYHFKIFVHNPFTWLVSHVFWTTKELVQYYHVWSLY